MKKKETFLLLVLAVLLILPLSCGGRRKEAFKPPYPQPPGLGQQDEKSINSRHPVSVYWSNSDSEEGYSKSKNGEAPKEFLHYWNALKNTFIFGYDEKYFIMQNINGTAKWGAAPGVFDPTKPQVYNAIKGGSYPIVGGKEEGPLQQLYYEGKVKPDDLTIVITDLEEQGIDNTILAKNIRNLLDDEGGPGLENAAAVIAAKLPFYGTNWKPDRNNPDKEIMQDIKGGAKPLYMIITGKKDAVNGFVNAFEPLAKKEGFDYEIVSTLMPGGVKSLMPKEIKIPESAGSREQNHVYKGKVNVNDIFTERNETVPDKIWNLDDETNNMSDYFVGLTDQGLLPLKLLTYHRKSRKNEKGRSLWQLNIEFDVPQGVDISNLKPGVENYRYLSEQITEVPAASSSGGNDDSPSKKRKNKDKEEKAPVVQTVKTLKWDTVGGALIVKDFDWSKDVMESEGNGKAVVFAGPADKRKGEVISPVICFDLVVRSPVSVPAWADDYDDAGDGNTVGKTWYFKVFLGTILGLDPDLKPKLVENGGELIRVPVVLTNLPARGAKK